MLKAFIIGNGILGGRIAYQMFQRKTIKVTKRLTNQQYQILKKGSKSSFQTRSETTNLVKKESTNRVKKGNEFNLLERLASKTKSFSKKDLESCMIGDYMIFIAKEKQDLVNFWLDKGFGLSLLAYCNMLSTLVGIFFLSIKPKSDIYKTYDYVYIYLSTPEKNRITFDSNLEFEYGTNTYRVQHYKLERMLEQATKTKVDLQHTGELYVNCYEINYQKPLFFILKKSGSKYRCLSIGRELEEIKKKTFPIFLPILALPCFNFLCLLMT